MTLILGKRNVTDRTRNDDHEGGTADVHLTGTTEKIIL